MKYIIANWKQNKTLAEYTSWVDAFFSNENSIPENVVCITAPSFVHLPLFAEYLKEKDREDLFLASQDISQFKEGKHTGLVGARQVSDFASFAIIGHSEQRSLHDTPETVNRKIKLALENSIVPIVCFSSVSEFEQIKKETDEKNILFAFEPLEAIGTGKPENPAVIDHIVKETGLDKVIYGGSVDVDNISVYLKMSTVAGFLVGTASLDPARFRVLIDKVS